MNQETSTSNRISPEVIDPQVEKINEALVRIIEAASSSIYEPEVYTTEVTDELKDKLTVVQTMLQQAFPALKAVRRELFALQPAAK